MSTVGSFRIDPDELENLASKIDEYNNSLQTLKSNFDSTYETMTTAPTWVGTTADVFKTKCDGMSSNILNMVNCLNDISADFKKTAKIYRES